MLNCPHSFDRGALCQEYRNSPDFQGLPRPYGKGASAEVGIVAYTFLAVRIISALLSQKCGVLSKFL